MQITRWLMLWKGGLTQKRTMKQYAESFCPCEFDADFFSTRAYNVDWHIRDSLSPTTATRACLTYLLMNLIVRPDSVFSSQNLIQQLMGF